MNLFQTFLRNSLFSRKFLNEINYFFFQNFSSIQKVLKYKVNNVIILNIKDIQKLNNRKRIYRPFIDSEINHKRHFIKIPFINKGIEFIDLPSIFKDRSVTSAIPAYFQNSEPPIICYKYNKPIRNTVFNFNKIVSGLDIHENTPES